MAVLAKFIPLIYVLREGKPGSLRSVIYKALPLRGRGVALAAGALFGSFGSVQYYTWRDSMSKPPEADLDSELKSAKNDSADYKSSTLLVEVVGGWWPWRRKKWRECWAELRNDTLFLFQRRDQDIVGSGSGGGGGGGDVAGSRADAWQLRQSSVEKHACEVASEAFSQAVTGAVVPILPRPWTRTTTTCSHSAKPVAPCACWQW